MALPKSFTDDGFLPLSKIRKRRRVMIGCEGPTDSGKTEFALSAPGPGICLCLDRNYEATLDNQNPPETRNPDFAFDVVKVPKASSLKAVDNTSPYLPYWWGFKGRYDKALDNRDCRTVILDGDSDSWELQRLAIFGKLEEVPPVLYTGANTARRAMYAQAHDSDKNIIATNKVKKHYVPIMKNGAYVLDKRGKPIREWDGTWERQGFEDQSYLWHIQLRHFYNPEKAEWGIEILKCKPNMGLIGLTLTGDDCNFAGLVQVVYPHVSLDEWGL